MPLALDDAALARVMIAATATAPAHARGMADEIRRAGRAAENLCASGGRVLAPAPNRRQRGSRVVVDKLVRAESRRPRTGLVVLLARQRGSRFLRVLPTLVEDLFDVVGRTYDGVDYVVLDDVRETMLDPAKGDHPLAAVGVVAQTPCDVAANLDSHSGLAEADVAAVMQFKAHGVPHDH
jgi:hypothetical protein